MTPWAFDSSIALNMELGTIEELKFNILWPQVYCRTARNFGGELNFMVWQSACATAKLKLANNISYLHIIICMAILCWTAKFNIVAMTISDSSAKSNSCQYFWLYSMYLQCNTKFMIMWLAYPISVSLQLAEQSYPNIRPNHLLQFVAAQLVHLLPNHTPNIICNTVYMWCPYTEQ